MHPSRGRGIEFSHEKGKILTWPNSKIVRPFCVPSMIHLIDDEDDHRAIRR